MLILDVAQLAGQIVDFGYIHAGLDSPWGCGLIGLHSEDLWLEALVFLRLGQKWISELR